VKINLNIDRLVLEGIDLPPHRHAAVKGAAERELTRLLASESEALARLSGGNVPHLTTADIHIRRQDGSPFAAEVLGNTIARAVFKKIRP
jgi:hypothetical protein